MRIVHIIPGVDPAASEQLLLEHEKALESSSIAANLFRSSQHSLRVCRVTDPAWSVKEVPMVETVLNQVEVIKIGTMRGIRPRLRSFLPDELIENSDTIIFTNSDICVAPDFYNKVIEIVDSGTFAGSIHRKTVIGVEPGETDSLRIAQSSLNWYQHPGSDCFFFPTTSARMLRSSKLYMGVPPVGRSVVVALSALNPSYKTFRSLGLTLHFGNDMVWSTASDLVRLRERNTVYWFFFLIKIYRVAGYLNLSHALYSMPWPGPFKLSFLISTFLRGFVSFIFQGRK
jgi:hypothetical protein